MRSVVAHIPRFREARAALPVLAAREDWQRQAIERYQLERLNRTWARASAEVPYYRAMSDRLGLPARFDSLEQFSDQVPILNKTAVRDTPQQFLSERPDPGEWHHTSGSSGSRTAVYCGHDAHRVMLQAKYRFYQSWGVDFDERWAFIWGNAGGLAHGWAGLKERVKTPMLDWARGRLRLSPYDLRPEILREHLEQIARFRPAAIYTHSMAGHLLAAEAQRIGWACPSLKLVVLTAEPVRSSTITLVERAMGVPAVAEYGCTECGYLAGHDADRQLRVREDIALIETLPREDGAWDVVVSVLDNTSFPLLRYKLGDVCAAPIQRTAEGFAVLPEVRGRDFDLVTTGAGAYVHGQAFEDILDKYDGIRRWQVHQDETGRVDVKLECETQLAQSVHGTIAGRLEQLVPGFELRVNTVDHLKPAAGSKHRAIISDYTRQAREVTTP